MSQDDQPLPPPAGRPSRAPGPGPDPEAESREDRLPPPVFVPGVRRRNLHRSPDLPPAGSSLPRDVVFEPDDPPRPHPARVASEGRDARANDLATLLDTLAEELRQTGSLRLTPASDTRSDPVEASLRGFLTGVLVSGAIEARSGPSSGSDPDDRERRGAGGRTHTRS